MGSRFIVYCASREGYCCKLSTKFSSRYKSTVPVGTNDFIKKIMEELCNERVTFNMVSNPEFLRQGSAVMDTMQADRIIIGSENDEAAKKVQEMYRPLNVPFILTSIRSAEMIKYASNAFLATKISFINEVANLCGVVGADVKDVAKGMGKDKRIGEAFYSPVLVMEDLVFQRMLKRCFILPN